MSSSPGGGEPPRDVGAAGVAEDARAALTIADASRATGITRDQLRRDIDTGRFPGAFREATARGPDTGRWRISVADLVAAGCSVDLAALARPQVRRGHVHNELERLHTELAEERARRIAAETLAEARAQALDEALRALRGEVRADPDSGQAPAQKRSGLWRAGLRGNWLH